MRTLVFVLLGTSTVQSAAQNNDRPWLDSSMAIPQRVELLMSRMTLQEKAAQLLHTSIGLDTRASSVASHVAAGGMGAMTIEANSVVNGSSCGAECRIGRLRELQLAFLNGTRLGIPLSFVIETSHCGAAGGTIFPMGVTQGASWNTTLAHEVGTAIAQEARAWGGDRGLSPEINVCTDPRFGRMEENFGEDPCHVSAFTTAAVAGLQGGTAKPSEYLPDNDHVVCEAKHCCAYGAGGRDGQSADISPKTLHDIYLRSWDNFVAAGGRGMMMSHNEINGYQCHASEEIMTEHFRNELGYEGFFASDAGNVEALVGAHVAYNATDAAAIALAAGMDQTMGVGLGPSVTLPGVKSGEINATWIERACAKVLTQKFAARLFDGALPDPSRHAALDSKAHRQLARQVAEEGAVLLINQNKTLPLDLRKHNKIALIGPNAGCTAMPQPPPPPPPGICTPTTGIDCPGSDIDKIDNVTDVGACCQLCLKNAQCKTAVLATGALPGNQNQCLLKSSCDAPTTMPNRIVLHTGRHEPAPNQPDPWNCLAQRAMLGGYSNLEQKTDAFLDNHAHVVTLLEAAQQAAKSSSNNLQVSFAPGVAIQSVDQSGIANAVKTAESADLAIVVLGDTAEGVGYDGGASTGEGADRTSIDLAGVQLDLLDAIISTGVPTVVVLVHGRSVGFGEDHGGAVTSKFGSVPMYLKAGAVVAAWRPGVEGGNALWSLLTGATSFSGRLAQAWPHNAGAVHLGGISPWYEKYCSEECPSLTINNAIPHGLTLDPTAPAFPFGYGLDYLAVRFTNFSIRTSSSTSEVPMTARVELHNAATMAGAKVVQVYFTPPVSPSRLTRYRHMLAGFTKVYVGAGSTATVEVPIRSRDLAHWIPKYNAHVVDSGTYTLYACHDSRGLGGDAAHVEGLDNGGGGCLSRTVVLH